MKKLSLVLTVLMLSVLFITSVSAELSPTNKADPIAIVDGDGNEIDLSMIIVTEPENAPESSNMEEILAELEEKGASSYIEEISPDLEDHVLYSLFDAHTVGDVVFPVTITFQVAGVSPDDEVIIIHYLDEGWEIIIPDSIGNNTVTATFDSLSPIGICVKSDDAPPSPQTGDNVFETALILGVSAIVILGSAAFLRRSKEN